VGLHQASRDNPFRPPESGYWQWEESISYRINMEKVKKSSMYGEDADETSIKDLDDQTLLSILEMLYDKLRCFNQIPMSFLKQSLINPNNMNKVMNTLLGILVL